MDWASIAPDKSHEKAAADLLDRYAAALGPTAGDDVLFSVAGIFARFPYENVTKLIRKHTLPPGPSRFRLPDQVATEHLEHGAGGTCFSLSTLFGRVLLLCGHKSYPVLARMKSSRTLHTGLVVPWDHHRFLLDPGYLVHRPLEIRPAQTTIAHTESGPIRLEGEPDGVHFNLYTGDTWRYRFADRPLTREQFTDLWIQSFDWVMMNQIHLSRLLPGGYLYAHGHRIRQVQHGNKRNFNIRSAQAQALCEHFGLNPAITEEALAILAENRGERKP